MYLIYTDETGTNIGDNSSRFLFYGGLIVHESKLNTLELQLENIVAQFLGLDNLVEVELHTTEIFNYLLSGKEPDKKAKKEKFEAMKEKIEGKTLDDFANFIEELIQFLNKINIPLKVSLVDKEHKIHNIHRISKEASYNAYSFKIFLNMVDKFLSSKNERGLLIADSFDGQLKKELKNKSIYEKIQDENLDKQKELIYLRILYESLDWKVKPSFDSVREFETIAPMKYSFESKNMFIVDNINYTSSQDSIINQITDALLFVLRKSFEIQTLEIGECPIKRKLKEFYDRIKINIDEMFLKGNLDMELLYTDNGKVQHRSLKDNNEMDIIKEYSNEIDYESTTEVD